MLCDGECLYSPHFFSNIPLISKNKFREEKKRKAKITTFQKSNFKSDYRIWSELFRIKKLKEIVIDEGSKKMIPSNNLIISILPSASSSGAMFL